jgi:hypothetical protein
MTKIKDPLLYTPLTSDEQITLSKLLRRAYVQSRNNLLNHNTFLGSEDEDCLDNIITDFNVNWLYDNILVRMEGLY